jgi:hypothetical protein
MGLMNIPTDRQQIIKGSLVTWRSWLMRTLRL